MRYFKYAFISCMMLFYLSEFHSLLNLLLTLVYNFITLVYF